MTYLTAFTTTFEDGYPPAGPVGGPLLPSAASSSPFAILSLEFSPPSSFSLDLSLLFLFSFPSFSFSFSS